MVEAMIRVGQIINLAGEYWCVVKDGDDEARAIFNRHYSRRRYRDGRHPKCFVGPGEKMVLLGNDGRALFIWRKFISMDKQGGINCAVFRNEGPLLSSALILQAEQVARQRWGQQRLYTWVDPRKVRSPNPGYCFLRAGWQKCGRTKGGLLVLEKVPTE